LAVPVDVVPSGFVRVTASVSAWPAPIVPPVGAPATVDWQLDKVPVKP